ncbi:MAG: hypothetical protein H3C38_03835 [Rhodospirillales bacterium]|nr:hypothetical protein [Rhodospirillales bacterium]
MEAEEKPDLAQFERALARLEGAVARLEAAAAARDADYAALRKVTREVSGRLDSAIERLTLAVEG